MNKLLALYDGLATREKYTKISSFDTSIDIICHETGEVIFKGLKNKVIIPGSSTIARALFDVSTEETIPSYNDKMNFLEPEDGEITDTIDFPTDAKEGRPKVFLFCCGIDGCGTEGSQVYPVDYKYWISPENLVPFRYQVKGNDLSDHLRETYFGRAEAGDGNFLAYYFKRFSGEPVFVQHYVDGTPIDGNIFDSSKADPAESYIELRLVITKDDLRDYFINTVGIDEARINSISLCTAWPKEIDEHIYFQDIRPLTKLHISNEHLMDITKGIDIIYHIYM